MHTDAHGGGELGSQEVAQRFAGFYYNVLGTCPLQAYRFYEEGAVRSQLRVLSDASRPAGAESEGVQAEGCAAIQDLVSELVAEGLRFQLRAAHGQELPGGQVLAAALGSAVVSAGHRMEFVEVFVLQRHAHSSEYYVTNDTLCLMPADGEAGLREMLAAVDADRGRLCGELEEARRAAAAVEEEKEAAERRQWDEIHEHHRAALDHVERQLSSLQQQLEHKDDARKQLLEDNAGLELEIQELAAKGKAAEEQVAGLRSKLKDARKEAQAQAHRAAGGGGLAARVQELEGDLERARDAMEVREVAAAGEVRRAKELSNRMVRSLREKQEEIEAAHKQTQALQGAYARAERERAMQLHAMHAEGRKDREKCEELARALKRYVEATAQCKTCSVKVAGKVPLKKSDAGSEGGENSNAPHTDLLKKRLAAARARAVELEGDAARMGVERDHAQRALTKLEAQMEDMARGRAEGEGRERALAGQLEAAKDEAREARECVRETEGFRDAAWAKARSLKAQLEAMARAREEESKEFERLRKAARALEEREKEEGAREAEYRRKEGDWARLLDVEKGKVSAREGEVKAAMADSAAAQREAGMWRGKYEESQRELTSLRQRWDSERGQSEEALLQCAAAKSKEGTMQQRVQQLERDLRASQEREGAGEEMLALVTESLQAEREEHGEKVRRLEEMLLFAAEDAEELDKVRTEAEALRAEKEELLRERVVLLGEDR